jgi:predicted nucleotidyltransferase
MHHSIAVRRRDIIALCQRIGVRRLDLFGSATGEGFDEATSDADFVVEFDAAEGFDYFDAYFSLKEGLETLLGRPVDLVTSQSVINPYFLARIEQTREPLYAA